MSFLVHLNIFYSFIKNLILFILSIFFKGSYDKNVYVLDANTGFLVWQIETKDVVKSSPCIDIQTGFVYVGSHDKHLYCLNIEVKMIYSGGPTIFLGYFCCCFL